MTTAQTTSTAAATKRRRTSRPASAPATLAPSPALKLCLAQASFAWALDIVGHAVASKSTLPVLGNVLLVCERGRLTLAATNLEIGIVVRLDASIAQDGGVTIPAKLLTDVVGHLPGTAIDLELDVRTQTLGLRCDRFETNIKGIDAEEFPAIPTIPLSQPIAALPAPQLRQAIDQVVYAAATDDTRPVLAGVLIRLKGAEATFAAADGYRLAVRTIELGEPAAVSTEMIVPARALIELARVLRELEEDEEVELFATPAGSQLLFHTERVDITTRTIEGKYPDFERIIPKSCATLAMMNSKELAAAVRLASYFASASANIVRLTIEPGVGESKGQLTISANAAEVGDNKGVVACDVQGAGGQLALNVVFFAETLQAIKTSSVVMEMQESTRPGVLKPAAINTAGHIESIGGQIAIVMPMTVRD